MAIRALSVSDVGLCDLPQNVDLDTCIKFSRKVKG
jgi:hypothetical protein